MGAICVQDTPSGVGFHHRRGTMDWKIFSQVVAQNEYLLPDTISPNAVIIDIGAHVGSFSHAAFIRGARRIYAFEAHPENFEVLRRNFAEFEAVDELISSAAWNHPVWRNDIPSGEVLWNEEFKDFKNTGGVSVLWNNDGMGVASVQLDEVLRGCSFLSKTPLFDKIDLLKVDCEGSEYPLLFTSKELRRCASICGEYHEIEHQRVPERAKVEGFAHFDRKALKDFLTAQGFEVTLVPQSRGLGLFFATRR